VSTLEIVVLVLVAVLLLLAVGGAFARKRQLVASQGRFDASLQEVNRDLAAAHAEDRGWERTVLEGAAREAYAGAHDGSDPGELELVQVVDRPGTDEDKAVFRCGPEGRERLTLGRRDGQWVLETLE